jgi:hypothetical protein
MDPENQSQPAEGAASPPETANEPSKASPSRPGLLNPETKLGRNLRSLVRAFLYGLIMFAFGMLFFFILVRPEIDELDIARTTLRSNQTQLSSLQATLTANQNQLTELKIDFQKSQAELQKAELGANLLELLDQIYTARIAVLNKDGPTAQQSLTDARTSLNGLLPAIKTVDPGIATQLDARLTLASSELIDNPATTQSDLALLNTTLVNFDKVLAGNK